MSDEPRPPVLVWSIIGQSTFPSNSGVITPPVQFKYYLLILTTTAIAGTSPSLKIIVNGIDSIGGLHSLINLSSVSVNEQSASLGPGMNFSTVMLPTFQVNWTLTGTGPTATFNAFLYGYND